MEILPHPQLLEALFAFRTKVSNVFRDVLGIHEINHIALTQIDSTHKILTFSSTPAMEFNLFNSNLWRFDKSYHPDWFKMCTQANWQSLYNLERFDELYYLKQVKHHYPLGYSLGARFEENFYIYSFASHRGDKHTEQLFKECYDDFYKIGLYCTNLLSSLFLNYSNSSSQLAL